jgi:plastocyanin
MKLPLIRVVAGIAFLVLALAAASARRSYFANAGEEKPAGVTVGIDNFSFAPKEITVAKGTTITWVNMMTCRTQW